MNLCYICNEKEDVHSWKHPENQKEYSFCGYCLKSIIGICAECSSILSKMDPIGINNDGQRICYKCSAKHDFSADI